MVENYAQCKNKKEWELLIKSSVTPTTKPTRDSMVDKKPTISKCSDRERQLSMHDDRG